MRYDDVIGMFRKSFPELKAAAETEMDWWDGREPPVHVFFGSVLGRFLKEGLSTMANPALIDRVFEFLESMAASEDKMVREVVSDTILEKLGDDEMILDRARTFMRPHTSRMSEAVEKSLGRERGWTKR